jgi:prolyl-tRNA synthetase
MFYSRLFIPTVKEVPKDATIASHILMIRAGLIKKITSGIYSFLPLGYRVIKKVEEIVREEMDGIGSNEFSLPVIIPGELWKTSGRWNSMGPELYRLKDRNTQEMVLAPTHEEVFTFILQDHIKSYRDLPLSVYQIGLKFRDEIRPRFGVMRGKTFIMKDAYSFHRESDAGSLDKTYRDMAGAYRRIFRRCGLETLPVAADSGAMGGSASEEFMVPSQVGEEEIVRCQGCGYVANREKAVVKVDQLRYSDTGALETVETPGVKTIDDLASFLRVPPTRLVKSLVYKTSEGEFAVALIRGDLEVNTTKLKNALGVADIAPAEAEETLEKLGIPFGFVGPVGLEGVKVVADHSVRGIQGGVTGANRIDLHYRNVKEGRDFSPEAFLDLRLAGEQDRCASCGGPFSIFRGIELGHIFKLGNKYTKAFGVAYLDEDGLMKTPIMGCYGIGVERTAAAVIEQNHDDNGIIWPISVAPFHVHLLPIRYEGESKEKTDALLSILEEEGFEVLVDDRNERPGVKFKDADLIGIPFRVTLGDKELREGKVKLTMRKTGRSELVGTEEIGSVLRKLILAEMAEYSASAARDPRQERLKSDGREHR